MVLRHVDMLESEARRRCLPRDDLRLARPGLREECRGDCERNEQPVHGRPSMAGTRVPVTMRPGPESALSTTATCSGETVATRLGPAASCSYRLRPASQPTS